MNKKNPILNFRKKNTLDVKKEEQKIIEIKKQNYSSMITKTRESIDMTEHS
jgi:hypothetical protein